MGLCQELGDSSVVDWPYKPSYHGLVHRYPNPYADPAHNPALEGAEGVTAPFTWMPACSGGREWAEDEVAGAIDTFDLVVLASPRKYNDRALTDLVQRTGRHAIRRLVMVDGEDHEVVSVDHIRRFQPSVYFKRELLQDAPREVAGCRIEPLPFASPWTRLPSPRPPASVPREVDVAFMGGLSYPGGKPPIEAAARRVTGNVCTRRGDFTEYADSLSRAKIAVATRGYGYDTQRICDIAVCEGTLLALERQPVVRPNWFEDGVHCLLFDSPEDLERKLREYLQDEERRQRVAAAGYALAITHHTCQARARQFLQEALR